MVESGHPDVKMKEMIGEGRAGGSRKRELSRSKLTSFKKVRSDVNLEATAGAE